MIFDMILVFAAVIFADIIWVNYIDYVSAYKPVAAANYAVLIYAASSFAVITYTENHLFLIPIFIASWIGTYLVVKLKQIKNKKINDGEKDV